LTRAGIADITLPDLFATGKWPSDLIGTWHHMGTTRMSETPSSGVVDRNCRVHGMGNLFIAGSSVFPTAGSNFPTMTLAALAIRLADHLQEIVRSDTNQPSEQNASEAIVESEKDRKQRAS
jgi:choline dehydrogenase-like flavoprotein